MQGVYSVHLDTCHRLALQAIRFWSSHKELSSRFNEFAKKTSTKNFPLIPCIFHGGLQLCWDVGKATWKLIFPFQWDFYYALLLCSRNIFTLSSMLVYKIHRASRKLVLSSLFDPASTGRFGNGEEQTSAQRCHPHVAHLPVRHARRGQDFAVREVPPARAIQQASPHEAGSENHWALRSGVRPGCVSFSLGSSSQDCSLYSSRTTVQDIANEMTLDFETFYNVHSGESLLKLAWILLLALVSTFAVISWVISVLVLKEKSRMKGLLHLPLSQ